MNLWSDSGRKWALEAVSKPEIEGKHLHHKDMSNYPMSSELYHLLQLALIHSLHVYKVFNLN